MAGKLNDRKRKTKTEIQAFLAAHAPHVQATALKLRGLVFAVVPDAIEQIDPAAHLTRLCCGLEHGGDPGIYAAIQRWLNGAVAIEKQEAPGDRGRMTVADLRAARNVEEHSRLAHDWAARVWEAYTAQHAVARNWIRAALSANPSGGELGRRRVHRKPR
jgi:hypothetical protein